MSAMDQTLERIASDIRSRLPRLERGASFNHAGIAPQPKSDAVEAAERIRAERPYTELFAHISGLPRRIREGWAKMLNVQPVEIGITHHTAEGVNVIAQGLDWRAGDRILTIDVEYPSNVYPWWNVRDRGVEVVTIGEHAGRVDLDELIDAIDERTRLVAVSHVQFASGCTIDLLKLGAACRARGVILFVDVAQSLGALPVDLSLADAAAWPTWKWQMGPIGMGGLYVSQGLIDQIRPAFVGTDGMIRGKDYLDYRFEFRPGAARFEYSSANVLGLIGVDEAVGRLAPLFEPGVEPSPAATRRIFANADQIIERVKRLGFEPFSTTDANQRSGIVMFDSRHDPEAVVKGLEARGIDAACRGGRLRLAPHFYNNDDDVDGLIEALGEIIQD